MSAGPMMAPVGQITPPPGVMGQPPAGAPQTSAAQPQPRDGQSLTLVAKLLQALRVAPPQEFITAIRAFGQGVQQIAQEKLPQMRAAAGAGQGPPEGAMPGGGGPAPGGPPPPMAPPMAPPPGGPPRGIVGP
jgi:hypothetical protein